MVVRCSRIQCHMTGYSGSQVAVHTMALALGGTIDMKPPCQKLIFTIIFGHRCHPQKRVFWMELTLTLFLVILRAHCRMQYLGIGDTPQISDRSQQVKFWLICPDITSWGSIQMQTDTPKKSLLDEVGSSAGKFLTASFLYWLVEGIIF